MIQYWHNILRFNRPNVIVILSFVIISIVNQSMRNKRAKLIVL